MFRHFKTAVFAGYARLLGIPFVYDHLRPLLAGGYDFSAVYNCLDCRSEHVVVDIGCGTGAALGYISSFSSYHGFDVDAASVDKLTRKKNHDKRVCTYTREFTYSDLLQLEPDRIIMMGLLHHLSDTQLLTLLGTLVQSAKPFRAITIDPYILDGNIISRLFAGADRGRFIRREKEYLRLLEQPGLILRNQFRLESGNHLALFFATCFESDPIPQILRTSH
jgi:SAM-dependent methyltransferase